MWVSTNMKRIIKKKAAEFLICVWCACVYMLAYVCVCVGRDAKGCWKKGNARLWQWTEKTTTQRKFGECRTETAALSPLSQARTHTLSHIAFIQKNKYINIKQKTLLNERAVKKNQSHTLIFSCSPFSIAVCPIEILTCWDKRRKKERGSSRENRRGAVVGGGRAQQLPVESSVD